ncbi:LOW QUALITY PROTEIN: hypothetical protein KUTeg_008675, partial [Tegillarca granosa]
MVYIGEQLYLCHQYRMSSIDLRYRLLRRTVVSMLSVQNVFYRPKYKMCFIDLRYGFTLRTVVSMLSEQNVFYRPKTLGMVYSGEQLYLCYQYRMSSIVFYRPKVWFTQRPVVSMLSVQNVFYRPKNVFYSPSIDLRYSSLRETDVSMLSVQNVFYRPKVWFTQENKCIYVISTECLYRPKYGLLRRTVVSMLSVQNVFYDLRYGFTQENRCILFQYRMSSIDLSMVYSGAVVSMLSVQCLLDLRPEVWFTQETIIYVDQYSLLREQLIYVISTECPFYIPKIDENVIDHLSEDELSKYLSKKGDRIAARNFPTQMSFKKNTLFDKIRRKFGSRKDQHLIGNTNAAKSTRLVELGWLDFDEKDKCYKQVKTKSGGGTRSVKVDKEANRDDILTLCQEKFFPNGMSKRGIISEFEITLRDFQQCEVSDRSIVQMYEKTGIRMLRFYLYTKRKNTLKQTCSKMTQQMRKICQTYKAECTNALSLEKHREKNKAKEVHEKTTFPSSGTDLKCTTMNSDTVSIISAAFNSVNPDRLDETIIVPEASSMNNLFQPVEQSEDQTLFTNDNAQSCNQSQDSTTECILDTITFPIEHNITVRRGQCLEDLLKAFSNHDIMDKDVSITRLLENGEKELGEGRGVTLDCLVEFWGEFYERCTTGLNEKVPFLRHDYLENEWKASARIFLYGWSHFSYIPVLLSPQFMRASLGRNIKIYLNHIFISDAEKAIECYLRKFIRESDKKTIENFLRFCTGSNLLIESNQIINVQFMEMSSFTRRPIGKTCTQTLQLSTNYTNYPEFRAEFNNILNSNVWVIGVYESIRSQTFGGFIVLPYWFRIPQIDIHNDQSAGAAA